MADVSIDDAYVSKEIYKMLWRYTKMIQIKDRCAYTDALDKTVDMLSAILNELKNEPKTL